MSEPHDLGPKPEENETEGVCEESVDVENVEQNHQATPVEEAVAVSEVEAALNQAQQALDEWRGRAYRSAADLENARRRHQREREELQKYGVEGLIKELLAVVDNLERALAHDAGGEALVEGVKMVLRQFMQVVGRVWATPFNPKGEEFDPQFHEAMSQIPSSEADPGTIIEVFQRGWKLHDRLVRPAMVVVAAAPVTDAVDEVNQEEGESEDHESQDPTPKDEASEVSEG